MKKLVTTPLTNTIWWATVNEDKNMITGKREDVTDNAIQAVFEHLASMEGFSDKGFAGYTYDKKKGGTSTICAVDDEKMCVISIDTWKEYRKKYGNIKEVK